jgi:hypothetical protein
MLAGLTLLGTIGVSATADAADQAPVTGNVTAVYGTKTRPPALAGATASDEVAAAAAARFFYAQASQTGTASGGWGYFDVARPNATVRGTHSLAELSITSADGKQIVEVGWTVDPALFGDTEPRLFVFHWVDGNPTCYNGCGFVPTRSGGGGPVGRRLTVGSVAHLSIWHAAGGWQVSADGVNSLGNFPDSLWGGRFTQGNLVQWFGEVADTTATSCIDMGYGVFASDVFAARIFNVGRFGVATTDIVTGSSHPRYYTAREASATELRYGGPGAC